jgi:hypothetical protein
MNGTPKRGVVFHFAHDLAIRPEAAILRRGLDGGYSGGCAPAKPVIIVCFRYDELDWWNHRGPGIGETL